MNSKIHIIKNMFNTILKRKKDGKHLDQGLRCQLGNLLHLHINNHLKNEKKIWTMMRLDMQCC